jgi:CheY-like chemotaxis protein
MSEPLALVYYSNLLPGSQLANRLQDLGYRVQNFSDAKDLVTAAEREKPMVVLTELTPAAEVCPAIAHLKKNQPTSHIPVLAFAPTPTEEVQDAAKKAGASIVAGSEAILNQLPQLLQHVLQVD